MYLLIITSTIERNKDRDVKYKKYSRVKYNFFVIFFNFEQPQHSRDNQRVYQGEKQFLKRYHVLVEAILF